MHVTVVVAVYNGAATIGLAVRSILDQTYRDWDLIVVDDCSTDDTPRVLSSLADSDSRITVLRTEKNSGPAIARNLAWRHATGEWIALLDADDVSLPDRLSQQVEFLRNNPHVDVLGSDAWLIGEDGRDLGRTRRPEYHADLVRRMYRETPFLNPTVMMRRHVLERSGGYDARLRWSEDSDLWLRTYRICHFHNLPVPLVRYRVGSYVSAGRMAAGVYVLLRAARREGLLLSRGWYALRWLAALAMDRTGLRRAWPRAAKPAGVASPETSCG